MGQSDAKTVGIKERVKKEPVDLDDNYYVGHAHVRYNRKASYYKRQFQVLKKATVGEWNKVNKKGNDPTRFIY